MKGLSSGKSVKYCVYIATSYKVAAMHHVAAVPVKGVTIISAEVCGSALGK